MTAGYDQIAAPSLYAYDAVGAQSIAQHRHLNSTIQAINYVLDPFRHLHGGAVESLIEIVRLDTVQIVRHHFYFRLHYFAGDKRDARMSRIIAATHLVLQQLLNKTVLTFGDHLQEQGHAGFHFGEPMSLVESLPAGGGVKNDIAMRDVRNYQSNDL